MRKVVLLAVMLAGSVAASAPTVDETRQVGEFSGVYVASGIRARVETGPTGGAVAVRGEPEALAQLRLEIKDGVLRIGYAPNSNVRSETPTSVALRMPSASDLGVSGGSQMDAAVPAQGSLAVSASGGGRLTLTTSVRPKEISVTVSGGSKVTLAGVESGRASLNLSGASRLSIAGRASEIRATLSGGSELEAASLSTAALQIVGSGGVRAAIHAGGAVDGALSGGSEVHVPSSASVNVSTSGGSSVQRDL